MMKIYKSYRNTSHPYHPEWKKHHPQRIISQKIRQQQQLLNPKIIPLPPLQSHSQHDIEHRMRRIESRRRLHRHKQHTHHRHHEERDLEARALQGAVRAVEAEKADREGDYADQAL